MTDDIKGTTSAAELRSKAEEKVARQPSVLEKSSGELDAKRLLHELQVHQVELEMQNEELRQTQAESNRRDIRFRKFIEETPAGYFAVNREGLYQRVNDSWLRMHGYDSADEIIGQPFSITQVDGNPGTAQQNISALLSGLPIQTGEFPHRCKDGSIGYHIFSAHPVYLYGEVVGLEGLLIDITDHKRAEEEKLHLEHLYQQAQKLESLGVLAGGIAHDFNNLLMIIMGNCSLAKLKPYCAEEYLTSIEKASERAADLCRQMLAYAGKAPFVQSDVNIVELINDMVSMLKSTIAQNVVIQFVPSPHIPSIKADANQIGQIVMNLIINASESIREAEGKVLVLLDKSTIKADEPVRDHLGASIPAGNYVCLEVIDSGCGMDNETKERLFEPFYTTKFTGRGLGMSAVLGIIAKHNGALQLSSAPGKGTTFKVFLPAQGVDYTENKQDQQTEVLEPWQGSGTIMLVEDEEDVRLIAKTMLEGLGFCVLEAVNGKEALELYRKKAAEITMVITDIGMPVMNGYALINELRKLNPELPVIISSGFGDKTIASKIKLEGTAGLLSKPYSFGRLRNVLKRALGDE
ncbi:MAG: response regulator [Geobacteraceae bacterium]|nr:response regulator [Geobacteraceae bacterium]NTW81313.1 response regulator [Geobacteraceae bacterium]